MEKTTPSSRRTFLKQAAVLSVPSVSAPAVFDAFALSPTAKTVENYTFLFQGDSITDGNRSRDMDWNHVLGHGYAYLIAARLWYQYPTSGFHFFNRGISGNQITDLAQRWSGDTIALIPNLVSILIGINDTSNAVNGNKNCTVEGFENDYRALLKRTKQELPAVDLVICEPFVLPVGKRKDEWDKYQREITGRQDATLRLAKEFGALYIPLQDLFNEAVKKYPPGEFWLWDGVHPMPNGHELIAVEWIEQVGKKLRFPDNKHIIS
jgi:lysophospholipase L1-like esterase